MNNRIRTKIVTAAAFTSIAILAVFSGTARAAETCEAGDICFEEGLTAEEYFGAEAVWTTSGSAASVDESAQNAYVLKGSEAYVRSNRTGTVILRYAVPCNGSEMPAGYAVIRYKDNGDNARVQAKLIKTDLFYGGEHIFYAFDSNDRPSRPDFQTYVAGMDNMPIGNDTGPTFYLRQDVHLECRGKAYHWEVRLTRGHGGDPRLQALGIEG